MKTKKRMVAIAAAAVSLTAFGAIACSPKDDDHNPSDQGGGVYYLSTFESGAWSSYSQDADVPAASKFTVNSENPSVFDLSVSLDAGAKVTVRQVGTEVVYGGGELFSALDALKGTDDNAISVEESGTFDISLDVTDKLITYKYTPKNGGTGDTPGDNTGDQKTAISVDITDASNFELNMTSATAVTKQLAATVTYDDGSSDATGVTWESSATSVATVSSSGLVTAVAAGTAQIKAKVGSVESDPVTVTVNGSVVFSDSSISLDVSGANSTKTLTPTIYGGASTEGWLSTNTDVATVSSSGVVTAVAPGTTTIRLAYRKRPGASPIFAECAVTVNIPVVGISLNNSELSLNAGSSSDLTVSVSPNDASNKNYTYELSSGGDGFVTVTKNGNTLSVLGVTETSAPVILTVKSAYDNAVTAQCSITVLSENAASCNISDSTLSLKAFGAANEGKTGNLTVSVANTTISSVTWSSSNTNVATVSGSGANATVTGVAFGKTTITASVVTANGNFEKTCVVTVTPDNMWLYGIAGAYPNTIGDAANNVVMTQTATGFTVNNIHITKDTQFRIAHDNQFNLATDDGGDGWRGLGYSHVGQLPNNNIISAGTGDNQFKVVYSGVYSINVDFSNAGLAKVNVINNSVDVTGIDFTNERSELQAGASSSTKSTTVSLTVAPAVATYEASDIVWECTNANVVMTVANDKKSCTVTAKDNAASDNNVKVKCTVKGVSKEITLSVVAEGAQIIPVTSIAFAQNAYTVNVGGGNNAQDWTVALSASVNSDASNQAITYSCADNSITIDGNSIKGNKFGTFTITATANGDTNKTATATVTFYSDEFFISGGLNSWWKTYHDKFGFTPSQDKKTLTLDIVINKDVIFKIYRGSDKDAAYGLGFDGNFVDTAASQAIVKDNSNNFKIVGDSGAYTVTIDLSGTDPKVRAERKGDAPTITAAVVGSDNNNKASKATSVDGKYYNTSVVASFAANEVFTLKTTGGIAGEKVISSCADFTGNDNFFTDDGGKIKCADAGEYRFDIISDMYGNFTVSVVEHTVGQIATPIHTVQIQTSNGWTNKDVGNYSQYGNEDGGYTVYFSYTFTLTDEEFGIYIYDTATTQNEKGSYWKDIYIKLGSGKDTLVGKAGNDNPKAISAQTLYFKLNYSPMFELISVDVGTSSLVSTT